jgi:hypothetical protein
MLEGFSDQAKAAIEAAHEESHRFGKSETGAGHLLVGAVALVPSKVEELADSFDQGTSFRSAGYGDPAATTELEQSLLPEDVEGRSTVFLFTPSTAARSLASGRRSPGPASPSAIARRISAAT